MGWSSIIDWAMTLPLFPDADTRGALFSNNRRHRYSLWRIWNPSLPRLAVIGLNPSTADESIDDPTIRRCMGFSMLWGYGGLWMLNLFAYRSTDPSRLKIVDDPVGPENDDVILDVSTSSDLVIAAWGNHGDLNDRQNQVQNLLSGIDVHCLRRNKNGSPEHPLYLPRDLQPKILWTAL